MAAEEEDVNKRVDRIEKQLLVTLEENSKLTTKLEQFEQRIHDLDGKLYCTDN